AYGAARIDGIALADVAAYIVLLPAAAVVLYAFFLVVTSLAFRLVDLRDLLFRLFQGSSYSGRWPLGIFPGWLRVALTAIVPIGLAVTVPSGALTGRLSWIGAGGALLTVTVVLAATRWIFRRSIRS